MIQVRRREERGPTRLGWLDSRHSFSFGAYYDPRHMGVSALRVINDDSVAPGAGFAPHSHRDMEILSYVKHGVLEHQDGMGHVEWVKAGEFQLMSAGTGITHSEYNPSATDTLAFLQIWILPDRAGIRPVYQQRGFPRETGLQLIASPAGRDGSLRLHQDASVYRLLLDADQELLQPWDGSRDGYLHVVSGSVTVDGELLRAGDGARLAAPGGGAVAFRALTGAEALLFDLP